ncbi:hypothetical protein [Salinispira pacifica]|uniref:hypothetical protein n=1 Tax=Salinispira pacifica TaxID=1307761 RepID=UPI001182DEDC|nr:hypothetical protein [Salinispira pacifica]
MNSIVKETLLANYLETVNSKPISSSAFGSLFEHNDVKLVFSDHFKREGAFLNNAQLAVDKIEEIIYKDKLPNSVTISNVSFEKNVYDYSLRNVYKITILRDYQRQSVLETLFFKKTSDKYKIVLFLLEISE